MTTFTQPKFSNHHAGIWTGEPVAKKVKKSIHKERVSSLGLDDYILAALAFLASPIMLAINKVSGFDGSAVYSAWSARRKARLADEKMWEYALQDDRLMADIERALGDAPEAAGWYLRK